MGLFNKKKQEVNQIGNKELKDKILLARSLLKNSNYIILDEALSEVSFDEEKEILDKIFESYSDKTIIYVSHKKEIIDLFKKKYKLERS